MTIKGTLETFNLRELLQMLSFNQKAGTLVLETERGPRTVHVDDGRIGFVGGDRHASAAVARVLRRRHLLPEDRLERAEQLQQRTGRFLGEVIAELGAMDPERFGQAYEEAVTESLFDLQLSKIQRFEFVEGRALAPDGQPGPPLEPRLVTDGLLLELTRRIDQWGVLCETVPSLQEVFEGTGVEVDLRGHDELDGALAERVIPRIDGFHTLDQVAERSDADRFTVLQVAVALLQGGAIRPVPSEDLVGRAEDLLARGAAAAALPLLRRALERGDAPPGARVRLADALEASGDPIAAAAELDTFAALADEGQAVEVFDALKRALALRDDDPVTAARLCDHYLRHRPWLRSRRSDALTALRTLVQGSSAAGRPLDAAQRLACFLQNNDAPSEELLVLADLYASGGERVEAASALVRRAEDLLAMHRVPQARDLLRRALEHDASRADARRRLNELEGEARRRRHRKRVASLLILLALLALGTGGAWWLSTRQATQALRHSREAAEAALREAEERVAGLVAAFRASAREAEAAADLPEGLPGAAKALVGDARALAEQLRVPLGAYAAELSGTGRNEANEALLRGLDQRRNALLGKAQQAVAEVRRRAETLLQEAEETNRRGEFDAAEKLLRSARNLGYEDPTVRERALVLLRIAGAYRADCDRALAEVGALRAQGDVAGAARRAFAALVELRDSDLTRRLRIPVELASAPAGAEVLLAGRPTGLRTPCLLEYSPFEDTTVVLRLRGRTSSVTRLPDFAAIQQRAPELGSWEPRVSADLPEGPRWRLEGGQEGRLVALWASGEVPIVLMQDGLTTRSVEVRSGLLGAGLKAKLPNPMRLGGSTPAGYDWRILGHRTLLVKTPHGESWEVQCAGRLERRPLLVDSVFVIVDEAGTLYAFQAATGTELWRRGLGAPPSQAPYASSLGVLTATLSGSATAFDPRTGATRNLAPAGRGLTLALPSGNGVVLVGVGAEGLRRMGADGTVTVLGEAQPAPEREPYVGAEGVAWISRSGVWWLPTGAGRATAVPALGTAVERLAGAPDALYAAGADGVLRAADPRSPEKALWATPLGGPSASAPVVAGDAVFILVDGALVAVER